MHYFTIREVQYIVLYSMYTVVFATG